MAGPQDRGQDPSPAASESGASHDAFLSHNSADKPAVTELAQPLREVEIKPFLDAWHLVPGEPWQEALEEALEGSRGRAVVIGPQGSGSRGAGRVWGSAGQKAAGRGRTKRCAWR